MKTKIFSILILLFFSFFYSGLFAQFTDPTGNNGPINMGIKTIAEGDHYCKPIAVGHEKKTGTPRRLKFRAMFYSECWYFEENLPLNPGWNKVGKIAGIEEGYWKENWYKLHVGWRMVTINKKHILGIGIYGHIRGKILAHWLDSIPFNNYKFLWVDMYMGRNVWGLVVEDKSIGIHNDFTDEFWYFGSRFRKTFYFGGKNTAPHNMFLSFDNIHFDKPGFQDYFNSRDYMIWNLSDFWDGNDFIFFANKQIEGSASNKNAVTSSPPEYGKQSCIIENGASITFIAGKKILLHPGFHVKPGGHFIAKIGSKNLYNNLKKKDSLVNKKQHLSYSLFNAIKESEKIDLTEGNNNNNSKSNFVKKDINRIFSIFPNPSPGLFTLQFNDGVNNSYSIEIMDMTGKTVYRKHDVKTNSTAIDLHKLPRGIYFVKVLAGGQVFTEKVIIK